MFSLRNVYDVNMEYLTIFFPKNLGNNTHAHTTHIYLLISFGNTLVLAGNWMVAVSQTCLIISIT